MPINRPAPSSPLQVESSDPHRAARLPLSPLFFLLPLLAIFVLIVVGGLYYILSKPVTVVIDGQPQLVRTYQTTVEGLLKELRIWLDAEDHVTPALDQPIQRGSIITVDKAKHVAININGTLKRWRTRAVQPQDILKEAGVTLAAHDQVLVDGAPLLNTPYTKIPHSIQIVTAKQVHIEDGGQQQSFYTVADTVGAAVAQANITLYHADRMEPDSATPITEDMRIIIQRAVPIIIEADGYRLAARTQAQTVGQALAELQLAPINLDYVTPDENSVIEANIVIAVVRVTEYEDVRREPISFTQVYQSDDSLLPGEQRILQTGQAGLREIRTIVRQEDGVEVNRAAPQIIIIQPAQPEIIAVHPSMATAQPTVQP